MPAVSCDTTGCVFLPTVALTLSVGSNGRKKVSMRYPLDNGEKRLTVTSRLLWSIKRMTSLTETGNTPSFTISRHGASETGGVTLEAGSIAGDRYRFKN